MSFKILCSLTGIAFLLVGAELGIAAQWVGPDGADAKRYGVYFFRNEFAVSSAPESLKIEVSADNRYRFYLNGEQLAYGPARGALVHWRYETLELAGLLSIGKNVLSAIVWNAAEHKPVAQVTDRAGFWVRSTRADLETGSGKWRIVPVCGMTVIRGAGPVGYIPVYSLLEEPGKLASMGGMACKTVLVREMPAEVVCDDG